MKIIIDNPSKPATTPPPDDYVYCKITDIPNIENHTCDEIILNDVLDFIHNRNDALMACIGKLRIGGTLSYHGCDIIDVAIDAITGRLTIDEVNELLYNGRQSIDNFYKVEQLMNTLPVSIIEKRLTPHGYFIKVMTK